MVSDGANARFAALPDQALAAALLRRREDYNQRFLRARHLRRRLDPADFLAVLRQHAAPLIERLAACLTERQAERQAGPQAEPLAARQAEPLVPQPIAIRDAELDGIVSPLYDLCLQLTAQDLLGPGARVPLMAELFDRLLPRLAGLVVDQPDRVPAALANALYHLAMEPAADPRCWIERLLTLAPRLSSVEALLAAGQVAAWRCGMAHYRDGALTRARQLEPRLLATLFERPPVPGEVQRAARGESENESKIGPLNGLQPPPNSDAANKPRDTDEAVTRLLEQLADPWFDPASPADTRDRSKCLQLVGKVGGFIGFDGPFAEPPEVARFGERIYALDSRQAWLLFADSFGAVLKGQGSDLPAGDPVQQTHFVIDPAGQVSHGNHRAQFPQLAGWRSVAATEHTLAVSLPHSHYLFLVALR